MVRTRTNKETVQLVDLAGGREVDGLVSKVDDETAEEGGVDLLIGNTGARGRTRPKRKSETHAYFSPSPKHISIAKCRELSAPC